MEVRDLGAARVDKAIQNAEIVWRILVLRGDTLSAMMGAGPTFIYASPDGPGGEPWELSTQEEALVLVAGINAMFGKKGKPMGLCVAIPVAKQLGDVLCEEIERAKSPEEKEREKIMNLLFGGLAR